MKVQKSLRFNIKTKPIPQARPRFYVRYHGLKGFVGAYDQDRSKSYKEFIAWHGRLKANEAGLLNPSQQPIALEIIFQMGKNNRLNEYHTKRPDLDNLIKSVKDALTGIIWKDDSQIVKLRAEKRFGPEQVNIKVNFLEGKG